MTVEEIRDYMNHYLPDDICVREVRVASDRFHSRYNAVGKTYCYTCFIGKLKPVFDKKYVYFMWDNELEGKKGFVANHIDTLVSFVNSNSDMCTILQTVDKSYPFLSDREPTGYGFTQFAYYDPNYELKIAYNNGETIESYDEESKKWLEVTEPKWWDSFKYRVKQNDKFCTSRQLAKWLAQGNGECKTEKIVATYYAYEEKYTNDEVEDYLVRRWEDSVWHTPTLDYMGIKQDEAIL
jgi:hypothetical protein